MIGKAAGRQGPWRSGLHGIRGQPGFGTKVMAALALDLITDCASAASPSLLSSLPRINKPMD